MPAKQLTVRELIEVLEQCRDKDLPVAFACEYDDAGADVAVNSVDEYDDLLLLSCEHNTYNEKTTTG